MCSRKESWRADETPDRKSGLNLVNQEAPQRWRRDLTGGLNYSACFGETLEEVAGIFNEKRNKTWLKTREAAHNIKYFRGVESRDQTHHLNFYHAICLARRKKYRAPGTHTTTNLACSYIEN